MAHRTQPIGLVGWGGVIGAALIVALIAATLVAVARFAESPSGLGAADWAAVRFTIWQAVASAVLSIALAVPVARAIARRRFPGRQALITLLGAPFILPVIVAVFGLLAVFGRGGVVNAGLEALGLPTISIYGAGGVVLAHVFLNLPLATRLILQGWDQIPTERLRLAASLGLDASAKARVLEWPMLRDVLPGAGVVIFIVCTTSFAVALTLGGGPRATTVELAIYQALRFEFDLTSAALLALVQLAIAGAAAFLALVVTVPTGFGGGLDRALPPGLSPQGWRAFVDAGLIALAALFLILPIAMVGVRGAAALPDLPVQVWQAAGRSLWVAACSTALAISLGLSISIAVARLSKAPGRLVETAGLISIAASPLVLGTGLFILVNPLVNPADLALAVTATVNAMMSLPFVLRALIPAVVATEARYGRLASGLGLSGGRYLTLVLLPRIRAPLAFTAGLSAALSMGDLGVIALFAPPEGATLPLQIYRLMGAYRQADAAAASTLLLMLTLAIFWAIDKGGRGRAEA